MTAIALVLHQITIYVDLKYAWIKSDPAGRTNVTWGAGNNSLLATVSLVILHWPQFNALVMQNETADYVLQLRESIPPRDYIIMLTVAGIIVLLLFIE